MATHFKGPILYSAARKGLENLQIGVWPDQAILYDDFIYEFDSGWTVVKDSGATVATTDNDGGSLQGNEVFQLPTTSGEKLYFESRFYVNSTAGSGVGQMDVFVGLCENFATHPENGFLSSNRIGFQLDDGSSLTRLISESSDTETETELAAAHNLTDGTYVTAGFVATKGAATNGTDVVEYFLNRKKVGTHTTNIPTALMTAAAISVSGDATGTKSAGFDYILTAQDRGVTY